MFVVSKVAAEHKTYEEAKAGIDETLEKMELYYMDMMIIHSPQPWAEVNQSETAIKKETDRPGKHLRTLTTKES